jgi:hypothetical protein
MVWIPLVVSLLGASAAGPEPPPARDAAEVAEAWFRQVHRFDALEAYEGRLGSRVMQFVVARRWKDGRAQLLVDIRAPQSLAKVAFLFLQNRDRSDDFFVYWPPARKVLRLTAAELDSGVLPIGRLMTLGDMRPVLPGELVHTPLPDTEVEGEPCRSVESRPSGRTLGFDRMVLEISKKTGVALRTRLYRGRREVRRISVSPNDVRRFDGRYLPVRREIEILTDGAKAELVLRNLMIDPPLPDQLFSEQSLITQRFPSF